MSWLADAGFALLRRVEPERAHDLALAALRIGLGVVPAPVVDPRLSVRAFGQQLTSPIGLAAGFDKNGRAIRPLLRLGFGSVEVGTVTPRPQAGNPRPRLFRLPEDGALINRMGFNNAGVDRLLHRLHRLPPGLPLAINIGVNRTQADPSRDLPEMVRKLALHARWISVNVSSPNTPRLRDYQAPAHLAGILAAIRTCGATPPTPITVKLSPDLPDDELAPIVECCVAGGAAGLVIANTTIGRPPTLRSAMTGETGGLSGRPLLLRSTSILRHIARMARGRLTLIGTGGVERGSDVVDKLAAGATIVQLYTAFALNGPRFLGRLHRELLGELERRGFGSASDAIGADLR